MPPQESAFDNCRSRIRICGRFNLRRICAILIATLAGLGASACGPSPETGIESVYVERTLPSGLVLSCTGCHMRGGGAIVSLDGLSASQIAASLQRYRSEADGATVMHRLARGYSDAQIREISTALGAEDEAVGE